MTHASVFSPRLLFLVVLLSLVVQVACEGEKFDDVPPQGEKQRYEFEKGDEFRGLDIPRNHVAFDWVSEIETPTRRFVWRSVEVSIVVNVFQMAPLSSPLSHVRSYLSAKKQRKMI